MTDLLFTFSEALLFALVSGVIGVFVGLLVMAVLASGKQADREIERMLYEEAQNKKS